MISKNRNWFYLLSFTPAIVVISCNFIGGVFAYGNIIYTLVILAFFEWKTKNIYSNESTDTSVPMFILLCHIPVQFISLFSLLYSIKTHVLTGSFIVEASVSTGLNSATAAVIVSHELIHKKAVIYRSLGKLLLITTGNVYLYIDHLKIHHKWVGTEKDHTSAKLGENLYQFIVRSVSGQFKGSLLLESERQKNEKKLPYGIGNYVVRQLVIQAIIISLLFYFIGLWAVKAWFIQCIVSIFTTEYTNYIQHYGLVRKGKERVNETHSWQSDNFISRFLLLDLPRHSDHHYLASKPFHSLSSLKNSPVLPTGYLGMYYIALIPKLWFKIMNSKIEEFKKINSN